MNVGCPKCGDYKNTNTAGSCDDCITKAIEEYKRSPNTPLIQCLPIVNVPGQVTARQLYKAAALAGCLMNPTIQDKVGTAIFMGNAMADKDGLP